MSEDPMGGGASITVIDGVVGGIFVGDHATMGFVSSEVISTYGTPSAAFIRTFANAPSLRLPFLLILVYYDDRFLATYDFEGDIEGSYIKGCPAGVRPTLDIWSPDLNARWADQAFLQEAILGPDAHPLRPVQEAISLDPSSLAQLLEGDECLFTPTSLW